MKSVKILSLAFGVILLVSAASFAQTSMTTTYANIPISANAQTGLVGEVDFVPLATGTIPTGESITVTYGAPISSISDIQVFVLGCNGNASLTIGTTAACAAPSLGTVTAYVNTKPSGSVVLSFGGPAGSSVPTGVATQLIRITGIRVDANSISPAIGAVINATVTNSTGLGSITNSYVPVATVAEPISISGPASFTAVPVTGGTTTGNLVISELYSDAFETKGATSPTQILVTLAPPAGFTFNSNTFGSNYVGTTQVSTTGVNYTVTNVTSTGFQINILTQTQQSLDKIDLAAGLQLGFTGTAPIAVTPGTVTITATLAPPASGAAPWVVSSTVANKPLLYVSRVVTGVNSVTPAIGATTFATTTLYSVFNVSGSGLETGIAVANPTGVLKSAGVTFFAVGQAGTIKVYFVPSDGSTVQSFTTSATIKPGLGLDANGFLPAGATWTVLVGDMIKLLPTPLTSFQGQIIFVTNFSNAHGINYIADSKFAVQAQGYEMLVIESVGAGLTGLNQ